MALRISGVVAFSLSKGPPGARRIMKKVAVPMRNSTGTVSRILRRMNLSMRARPRGDGSAQRRSRHGQGFWAGARPGVPGVPGGVQVEVFVGVMIEQGGVPTLQARADQEAVGIVIDRDHGCL